MLRVSATALCRAGKDVDREGLRFRSFVIVLVVGE